MLITLIIAFHSFFGSALSPNSDISSVLASALLNIELNAGSSLHPFHRGAELLHNTATVSSLCDRLTERMNKTMRLN